MLRSHGTNCHCIDLIFEEYFDFHAYFELCKQPYLVSMSSPHSHILLWKRISHQSLHPAPPQCGMPLWFTLFLSPWKRLCAVNISSTWLVAVKNYSQPWWSLWSSNSKSIVRIPHDFPERWHACIYRWFLFVHNGIYPMGNVFYIIYTKRLLVDGKGYARF